MNINKITALGVTAALILSCTACGSKEEAPAQSSESVTEASVETVADDVSATSEEAQEVQAESEGGEEVQDVQAEPEGEEVQEVQSESDGGESADGELPEYSYPGPELFYSVLYDYLKDKLMDSPNENEVTIPCPIIVYMDESNNDDIRVYGNFWIYNYALERDTLKTSSGGSYPGCIHLKSTDAGYEVTDMEIVEDGSNYTESAKKIFGEHYDDFVKATGDSATTEEIRAQIIANYVAANNLSVTAYQDYGWDPVALPKENIDTFYSDL